MDNENVNKILESEILVLREQANSLLAEADVLERLLNKRRGTVEGEYHLNQSKTPPINAYADYFRARSMKDATIAILKGTNRFIHKTEFLQIIKEIDPKVSREKAEQLVSALYTLKSDGKITNVKVYDKNHLTFWGAISWMDESGIKPEHTFSTEVLDSLEGGKIL